MVLEKMKMRKNTTKRKTTPTTKDAGKIVSIIKAEFKSIWPRYIYFMTVTKFLSRDSIIPSPNFLKPILRHKSEQ